eukprot:3762092-Alexandrium_andersonii.AAC.1
MLDTSAQQQEAERAKTLDPIWLQEVPDGDGQCGPVAELEEVSEIYVPDETRLTEKLDELLKLLDLDFVVPVKRCDVQKGKRVDGHKWVYEMGDDGR